MSVEILFNRAFYGHRPPRNTYHPENPSRLDIALKALLREGIEVTTVTIDEVSQYTKYVEKIHSIDYVEYIRSTSLEGDVYIDGDTYVSKDTYEVAQIAVALSVKAMEKAIENKDRFSFALVRPPGHHAGFFGKAMNAPTQGFCIFNNIAAAVIYGLDRGFSTAVIIDIDVHHGNGTQEIFWQNPRVIHIDIHELGIYPGTGFVEDVGGGDAMGTKINIPLYPYSRDDDYLYIVREVVLPLVLHFKPKCIAVSAGFDAYMDDGLASMELTDRFYRVFGSFLRYVNRYTGACIMGVLEGGYSVGLDRGLPSMLKGFEKTVDDVEKLLSNLNPSWRTIEVASRVKNVLKRFGIAF